MLAKMKPKMRCVTDEQYAARLLVCSSCSSLMEGHTCAVCGCIVQIRAMMADRACPHADSSRWAPLEDCGTGLGD